MPISETGNTAFPDQSITLLHLPPNPNITLYNLEQHLKHHGVAYARRRG